MLMVNNNTGFNIKMSLIKWIFGAIGALMLFQIGFQLIAWFTLGLYQNMTTGVNVTEYMLFVAELPEVEIWKILSEDLLGNLPFVDYVMAVVLHEQRPELSSLFQDLMIAAVSGLMLIVVCRINLLRMIPNKLIAAAAGIINLIVSVFGALLLVTYVSTLEQGASILGIMLVACPVLYAGAIFLSLKLNKPRIIREVTAMTKGRVTTIKSIPFGRLMLHTLLELLESICNNLFLCLISAMFVYVLTGATMPTPVTGLMVVVLAYVLYSLYLWMMEGIKRSLLIATLA